MSDVETLFNSQNLKMLCQCRKQGFVETIFNVKFLSREICVRCRDKSEFGVSDVEV